MKIAYTAPVKGESYVVGKNAAARLARSLCPDLPLLAFQTMHVPKMDADIPYLATVSSGYIRMLSVKAEWMSVELRVQFLAEVFPYLCKVVNERRRVGYAWPSVIVIFGGMIREISCSEGWRFPNRDEIIERGKKHPQSFKAAFVALNCHDETT